MLTKQDLIVDGIDYSPPEIPIQVEKIEAVINAEKKLIREMLVQNACDSAGHCAIGALLHAEGMTNKELDNMPDSPNEWTTKTVNPNGWSEYHVRLIRKAVGILRNEYGLHIKHVTGIVDANDAEENLVEDRPKAVMGIVRYYAQQQATNKDFVKNMIAFVQVNNFLGEKNTFETEYAG